MAIISTTLDTTPTTVYQSSGDSIVTSLYFCNTSTASLSFNMHLVPSLGTAETGNLVYYNVQIAPSDTYVVDTEKLMLSDGDTIQASTSLAGFIVTTISYMGY